MSDTMPRLILPYPVSANRYWRSFVPKGWTRATVHATPEAKAYKSQVGWLAKAAGIRGPVRYPIEVGLRLVPKNGICMDVDNAIKVALDALNGVAWIDDSQVYKLTIERFAPDGRARLEVTVSEYIPPPAALFSEAA